MSPRSPKNTPDDAGPDDSATDVAASDAGTGTGEAAAQIAPAAAEGEKPLPADIASLSYEAARDQLVDVVRRLESGQGGLEESISLWERGEMLGRRCQQWLDGARERLEAAIADRG